ncbi:unnamed protein product [Triticum turgidum subsp. durum]|uniref:Serpin domain-containing protein n=1 Tax=Triticum turgidum subsp. durum TaxID=4567 RepID=A0A9R0Z8M7_TRITD|nr:unnamed protein product [Triticum turgidum subsp. durum]
MATTLATDVRLSVAHQTRFALRLASAISSDPESATGNVAFSPVSLHVALSLITAGAGGTTRDQLVAILGNENAGGPEGLHSLADQVVQLVLADASITGGPRIAFANGVFVDASLSLKPSFQELAVCNYKSEVQSVDFKNKAPEVASQVNSWVENVTTGLIREILPKGSIDYTTRLVLKIPYQKGGDNRQFSMYILLPKRRDGLWTLAKRLSTESEFIDKHIPTEKVVVEQFMLPKFKISFGFEATNLLKSLGLQLPFSTEANLSEMVNSHVGLFISSIFHKSFVEVNEQGTEAAAATSVAIEQQQMPIVMDFVADHPFLFLIREDVIGVVLFIGHVANPLVSS